ncbi:MAG: hypothetical protein RL120_18715, partial [Gammaproteobacteria bacterium]
MSRSMATGIPRIRLDSLHSALAEGRLVITANNRTRDAVLLAWSDEQEPDAWLQPRVEAIGLWLQQLWEELAASGLAPYCDYRLLNPVQEQLLWTQIIEDERDALPLINTQATARLASQAYQLITQWQVDEAALHSYDGLLDIATFLRWKDRFRKRCHDLSAVSLADLVKQLLAAIAARDISVATGAILLNFEQPPPLYQQLLNCLVDEHGATMVYSNSSNNDPTAQLLQLPVSDRREETEACVSWVLAQQRHNPGAHIAIVSRRHLERATELEKVFYALSPGQMPPGHRFFNCYQSRFDPDRNEALRAALLLLNCNRELIGTADACRLLRADNIRAGVDSEARILLEQHLRRYKESVLRSSELRRLAAHTG